MAEFKETKGKWVFKKGKRSKNEYDCLIYDENKNLFIKFSNSGTYSKKLTIKESHDNGLLISKAPEFYKDALKDLELLKKVAKQLDALGGYLESDVLERIKEKEQLIKEATEI